MNKQQMTFAESVQGLVAGNFSALAPLFQNSADGDRCQIIRWHEAGLFAGEPQALAEALSCACFNGAVDVVNYLLRAGVDPNGGGGTGVNGFHWAANRGQLAVVEILISHGASLETRNMYDANALGFAVWSAINEPRPNQLQIIEALLKAGAPVDDCDYPSGNAKVDELLSHYKSSAEGAK